MTCKDCIHYNVCDELLECFGTSMTELITKNRGGEHCAFFTDKSRFVESLCGVDVKPIVRGEWIEDVECQWRCSVCGYKNKFAYTMDDHRYEIVLQDFFCPHCGADMKGTDENDRA